MLYTCRSCGTEKTEPIAKTPAHSYGTEYLYHSKTEHKTERATGTATSASVPTMPADDIAVVSGCGASVSGGAITLLCLICLMPLLYRKKKEK